MSDRRLYALLAGVAVVVLSAVAVGYARMRRLDRIEACALNLRTLHLVLNSGRDRLDPRWNEIPTGRAFWAGLPRWPVEPTRPVGPHLLVCPAFGRSEIGKAIDYRGPARPWLEMGPQEAIACDRPGNHGDAPANVLFKDGSLLPVPTDSEHWARALQSTAD